MFGNAVLKHAVAQRFDDMVTVQSSGHADRQTFSRELIDHGQKPQAATIVRTGFHKVVTPDMIRLMETACFHALQPFCDDGEITVGISIHVEHRAASGIGMQIHAQAELESFDGRFYTMRVYAHDGSQEIGRGTVGRAVVHVPSFVERMREKARSR